MYKVNHIVSKLTKTDYLEINNKELGVYANINLNLGGSLQDLALSGKKLISSENMVYGDYYNSAILFPFVNRIQKGVYYFQGETYKLFKNHENEGHAIHGLVYNKTFIVSSINEQNNKLLISLYYNETQPEKGFPFKYTIFLNYTFQKNSLGLNVCVKNDDEKNFPFTIGWHPYFASDDLYNSELNLNSNCKIDFDAEFNYKIGRAKNSTIKIKDTEFDDCYMLNSNKVRFNTPAYSLKIEFTSNSNYLQVYTPKNRKCIALEPQTGVANSFNNNLGLQVLKPTESFEKKWKINLLNTN